MCPHSWRSNRLKAPEGSAKPLIPQWPRDTARNLPLVQQIHLPIRPFFPRDVMLVRLRILLGDINECHWLAPHAVGPLPPPPVPSPSRQARAPRLELRVVLVPEDTRPPPCVCPRRTVAWQRLWLVFGFDKDFSNTNDPL